MEWIIFIGLFLLVCHWIGRAADNNWNRGRARQQLKYNKVYWEEEEKARRRGRYP
jgi:hypothetical protein